MVDASVGAKTGIDFMGLKNQIGLFNQPEQILIDTSFLQTLPQRELVSGFAEVLKHYLIADADAFHAIANEAKDISEFNWHDVVPRNIAIKQRIVDADPLENGVRKALNFGHTIGHAVESLMLQEGNQKLLHGEAVAVGMIVESYISASLSLLNEDELALITKTILRYYKLPYIAEQQHAEILKLIGNDKKNSGKHNRFSLLNGIGNFSIDNNVEEALIIEALKYYNAKLA
jgi:3-dehydroquinate synthase